MNLVCDYDAWHEVEKAVTVEMVLESMNQNIHSAKAIIKKAVASLSPQRESRCECDRALKNCIVTQPDSIPEESKEKLRYIIEKYIKGNEEA
jgi:5'-methylthioadenosine phosphorylase